MLTPVHPLSLSVPANTAVPHDQSAIADWSPTCAAPSARSSCCCPSPTILLQLPHTSDSAAPLPPPLCTRLLHAVICGQLDGIPKDLFKNYPALKAFRSRIATEPGVKVSPAPCWVVHFARQRACHCRQEGCCRHPCLCVSAIAPHRLTSFVSVAVNCRRSTTRTARASVLPSSRTRNALTRATSATEVAGSRTRNMEAQQVDTCGLTIIRLALRCEARHTRKLPRADGQFSEYRRFTC